MDVIEQLQRAAEAISSESINKDTKIDAFDTILSYVDDIDSAVDFCKIGGIFVLQRSLNSPFIEIRNKSALLVAELAQNNPYCQQNLLEAEILPKILNLLNECETAIDGLRAVSCLIRGYEPCLRVFIESNGLECLLECLQNSPQEKLRIRTTFLLNSLCNEFPSIKNDLIALNTIEIIIPLIEPQHENNIYIENLLALIASLLDNPAANFQSQSFELKKKLDIISANAKDKSECREILEYCSVLLENAFNNIGNTNH